jgi:hypothetical protein
MNHKTILFLILPVILVFLSATAILAAPGKPNFGPALYADNEVWGTKGTTVLPAPNEHNLQSFDKLFVITNGAAGQMAVGEAAPGNPNYNGGRWFTQTVMWTADGMDSYDNTVPVLMSYDEIEYNYNLGFLTITTGSPNPETIPDYFQCPLLPVK